MDEIGEFLDQIEYELLEAERFSLPRTVYLNDEAEIEKYDSRLIEEIMDPKGGPDVSAGTFDLYGVDFIFSSSGRFRIKNGQHKYREVDTLTIPKLRSYISEMGVKRNRILSTKIIHLVEGETSYTFQLKEAIDYINDDDRVVLKNGKWMKFNEDYLELLDSEVRRIRTEEVEEEFEEIYLTEAAFNLHLQDYGYEVADKNFEILKISGGPLIEAWDLKRDNIVYAVKFGTPQKLHYVVDQATNVAEIIQNRASDSPAPKFSTYCLWLGYEAKRIPKSIADSGSLILKQKIEAWARKCREAGIEPSIKISRKLKAARNSE